VSLERVIRCIQYALGGAYCIQYIVYVVNNALFDTAELILREFSETSKHKKLRVIKELVLTELNYALSENKHELTV